MGQQNSRHNCTCGCGAWERRPPSVAGETPPPQPRPGAASNVQRYVSALTERSEAECWCRRRRWPMLSSHPRPACVCTSYRNVEEEPPRIQEAPRPTHAQHCTLCSTDQLAAVLSLGARELRRDPYTLVGVPQSGGAHGSGEAAESRRDAPGAVSADGSAAELLVWSLHSYPQMQEGACGRWGAEDAEEQARARRAQEIARGVDAPAGFRPHLQVVCNGELRALLLRATSPAAPVTRVHTQVDYIHCLVPDLKEITACCFYWGKMDRYEAERLLDNKPEGTFLLRDSAQEEHLFSVSFRKYGRSLHARIEHFNHKFSFDSHDPAVYCADTVTSLIRHYKDPACVMFFEPMLTAPLPRTHPFSLQQLARAIIVSSTTYDGVEALPLPPRLRAYLKEYHYRQRVCVRRLDSLAYVHPPHPLA